ncbi:hypothetical protein HanIR_Chr09g0444091 [Helianthus annuus]|nr:hypothetical protein HanIR_Chr09g0444091 [Helianthus annuus]
MNFSALSIRQILANNLIFSGLSQLALIIDLTASIIFDIYLGKQLHIYAILIFYFW